MFDIRDDEWEGVHTMACPECGRARECRVKLYGDGDSEDGTAYLWDVMYRCPDNHEWTESHATPKEP